MGAIFVIYKKYNIIYRLFGSHCEKWWPFNSSSHL